MVDVGLILEKQNSENKNRSSHICFAGPARKEEKQKSVQLSWFRQQKPRVK